MSNLDLYNKVRQVPPEAKKSIQGGRLKGMTDINPMWRIKILTELFGPCGQGWYYEVTDKQIAEGANGEKVAFVDINLYTKVGEEWQKPIYGTGGSSFVAKEKNGLYTSDECFKMATTDAISVACKNLGIGADVYFEKGRTKYDNVETIEKSISDTQIKALFALANKKGYNSTSVLKAVAKKYNVPEIAQLSQSQYSAMVKGYEGLKDK